MQFEFGEEEKGYRADLFEGEVPGILEVALGNYGFMGAVLT